MAQKKKIVVVIPVRGGSKRFKHKNLAKLRGKHLLWYPISAAKNIASVDRVIVSTDSTEIARVARKLGAEVPFLRPKYLATDTSPVIDTVRYTVERLTKDEGYDVDLTLTSDLKTMTGVWMGDTTMTKALRQKKLIVSGASNLKKNIAVWLGTNYFADVKPARK